MTAPTAQELLQELNRDRDDAFTVQLVRDFGTSYTSPHRFIVAKVVPTENMREFGYDRVVAVGIFDTTDERWPEVGRRTYPAPVRLRPAPSGHGFVFRGHARIRDYLNRLVAEVAAEEEARLAEGGAQ